MYKHFIKHIILIEILFGALLIEIFTLGFVFQDVIFARYCNRMLRLCRYISDDAGCSNVMAVPAESKMVAAANMRQTIPFPAFTGMHIYRERDAYIEREKQRESSFL